MLKLISSVFLCHFFTVATRKFNITCVTHLLFLLDRPGLDSLEVPLWVESKLAFSNLQSILLLEAINKTLPPESPIFEDDHLAHPIFSSHAVQPLLEDIPSTTCVKDYLCKIWKMIAAILLNNFFINPS